MASITPTLEKKLLQVVISFYFANVEKKISRTELKKYVFDEIGYDAKVSTIQLLNAKIREHNLIAPYILTNGNCCVMATRNPLYIQMSLEKFFRSAMGNLVIYKNIRKSIEENFANNQEFNFENDDKEIKNILIDTEG